MDHRPNKDHQTPWTTDQTASMDCRPGKDYRGPQTKQGPPLTTDRTKTTKDQQTVMDRTKDKQTKSILPIVVSEIPRRQY